MLEYYKDLLREHVKKKLAFLADADARVVIPPPHRVVSGRSILHV